MIFETPDLTPAIPEMFMLAMACVVLIVATLITPAAAARQWTERLGTMVLLAGLIGGGSGIIFKGSGFYKTDSRSGSSGATSSAPTKNSTVLWADSLPATSESQSRIRTTGREARFFCLAAIDNE